MPIVDPRPKVTSHKQVSQPSATPQPSPPISPAPEVSDTAAPPTTPSVTASDVPVKKRAQPQSQLNWRQLLCCASKHREPSKAEKTITAKDSGGKPSSAAVAVPALGDVDTSNNKSSYIESKTQDGSLKESTVPPEPTVTIRNHRKGRFRSFFRRKPRPHVPEVVLCKVTKTHNNQIDNRLKVTAPTLLVTRHEAISETTYLPYQAASGPPPFAFTEKRQPNDNDAKVDFPDDTGYDYDHPLNADRLANHDDLGADSASDESLHTEDSFNEAFDQADVTFAWTNMDADYLGLETCLS
ncbi:unnamed protein product [Dibothriocephalus latus]|uniref:Uncharacterized protein n=1 Tax=Dibothriocephalus latus TaxID=60516 RepID=A0A3P7LFW2_DIBLA|nr:unnamed protein product [Dibothriocephalus latus]